MPEGKKYKVLIVDDDKFLLQMYATKFTLSGHEVTSAQNGAEALEKLREGLKPDIVLLDVVMPGVDGMEVLQTIHKDALVPEAVYVMLTNQSAPADIERAKTIGMHGYIVKATTIPSEVVEEVIKIREKKK